MVFVSRIYFALDWQVVRAFVCLSVYYCHMSAEASMLLSEAVFSPGIQSPEIRASSTVREKPWLLLAGLNSCSSFASVFGVLARLLCAQIICNYLLV